MAQHDYVIANQSGSSLRSDLNNALSAIVSNNSGSSEPTTTYAYQWWADTTNGQLKLRNAANSAWITIQELDGTMLMENGTAAAPGLAFASDLNTGFYRIGADQLGIATNGTAAVAVDASQRVGIGTTSPITTLHVDGSGNQNIRVSSTTHSNFIQAGCGSGSTYHEYKSVYRLVDTDNGERARIDSSGRLLVGTTSYSTPSGSGSAQYAPLVVQGYTGGSTGAGIVAITNGTAGASITSGTVIGVLSFAGNNASEFATVKAEADAACGAGDYPGRLVFSTTADGASSPTERMRITQSGVVLIGTDTTDGNGLSIKPGASAGSTTQINFDRVGSATVGYAIVFQNGGADVGFISHNNTSTTYSTSSDYRLKENITAVTDGITRLQQLKPTRFNFIAEPGKTVDGFLAHEAAEVVPECVTGEKDAIDADGNPVYQGIDQSKLVPLLTAALQEAVAKIESLEARLTAAGI